MAISTQSANLAWMRVKNALSAANAHPASQEAFRGLKQYLSQQGGNPDLQFIPVDGTYSSSDGGNNASQVLADAACTLYGIWLHKVGTTENIFKGTNHASTAATNGTQDIAIAMTTGNDANLFGADVVELFPMGRALSTGLTVTENTTRTGSTLTLAANRMDGFVLIGA